MQNIIVGIIIALAAFFSLRSLYRVFTGKSKGCGCSSSSCESCNSTPPPQQNIPKISAADKGKKQE